MADVAASQLELPEDMMYDSEEEDELVAALHLATYVPLQVVKTFVERRRSLTQPVKEHFPATVLFADISGFTKLADKLSKKDNGVALLTDIINSLFDPVIAIVTEYGGDVVKFAGDALQVMFPVFSTPSNKASPKSQLALSVVAAVECGLHLNEFIEQMNTTGPAAADARRGSASSSTTGGHTGKRSNWKRLTQVVKRRGLLGIWSSLRHKSNAAAAGGSRPVSLARNQGLSLYQLYNNYRQKTPAPGKAMSQRRFFASPTAQGNRVLLLWGAGIVSRGR